MRVAVLWVLAALVLWACAQNRRASDDDDGATSSNASSNASSTGSGVPEGPFSIVVNTAMSHDSLMQLTPAAGNMFVTLDVTLFNVSVDTPVSIAQTNFSLQTSGALVVQAHSVSASLEPSCRSDVAVAAGGMASCKLAFEIATSQIPTTLTYDDMLGNVYVAPVPPLSLGPCARQTCDCACGALFDCGLALSGSMQLCPGFAPADETQFVNECLTTCGGPLMDTFISLVDPNDCAETITSFKA